MRFFLLVYLTCTAALLPLLCFLVKAIKILLLARQQKRNSTEAKARILEVRVMNEAGRRIPFARLKVEVFAPAGEPFVADAEGFYSLEELTRLQPGAVIRVRCFACTNTPLQIVKNPARMRAEKERFAKDEGEAIAATTGPIQSRATRHRRLAFQ